jgi:hypothetical protein
MNLAAAMLLLAAQQTSQSIVPLGSYEINPAVQPYFHRYTECIETYVRERAVQPASTTVLDELYDAAVPACAEVRRHQYAGAERALRRSHQYGDPGDRLRILEDTFHTGDRVRNQYGAAVRREMAAQAADTRTESQIAADKESQRPPPPTLASDRPMGHLNIPDEIAPAIVPYVNCVMASRGVQMRSSGNAVQAPAVPAGSDCTPARAEAARQADAMLAGQHRGSRQQRQALIERTLTNVDNFAAASSTPPPGSQ